MSIPGESGGEGHGQHDEEGNTEPPPRRFGVLAHHLGVHVGLFAEGEASTDPDLLAVEEDGVGHQSQDGCEGKSVGEGEGSGEEQWRVLLVGFEIEFELGSQDARDVVMGTVARVVVAVAIGHDNVCGVAPVGVM